jgi:CubicO group peptidase (beta-lactamase class C family)
MPTQASVTRQDGALWAELGEAIPPVAEAYPDGVDVEVPPDTKWAYANHGFALLGEIVSRTEGAPVEQVLQRRVFEPLAMRDTDCLDQAHPALATPYHRAPTEDDLELRRRAGMPDPPVEDAVDGHNIRGRYQCVRMPAAGAVQSTIPDMARYASALLRKGAGIVRDETFDAMITPQFRPEARLMGIGLSFFRQWQFGRDIFEHGGGVVGGWNTHLGVSPDDGLALLIHLNLTTAEFERVISRIWQAVLGVPDSRPAAAPTDASILATAPGLYEAAAGALTNYRIVTGMGRVRIEAEGGGLMFRARRGPFKDGVRMIPADPADPRLFALDNGEPALPLVALQLGGGGVVGLRMDRLIHLHKVRGQE